MQYYAYPDIITFVMLSDFISVICFVVREQYINKFENIFVRVFILNIKCKSMLFADRDFQYIDTICCTNND